MPPGELKGRGGEQEHAPIEAEALKPVGTGRKELQADTGEDRIGDGDGAHIDRVDDHPRLAHEDPVEQPERRGGDEATDPEREERGLRDGMALESPFAPKPQIEMERDRVVVAEAHQDFAAFAGGNHQRRRRTGIGEGPVGIRNQGIVVAALDPSARRERQRRKGGQARDVVGEDDLLRPRGVVLNGEPHPDLGRRQPPLAFRFGRRLPIGRAADRIERCLPPRLRQKVRAPDQAQMVLDGRNGNRVRRLPGPRSLCARAKGGMDRAEQADDDEQP